jgi:uncharacterized protein YjbI with pentapeptide repeats
MADKLDPFDVEALESAVNDSATRVSTIWISFLIFSLYLLITATTVTQRQLLLAEPVKLPVLNIDLPLWGFFFLAPILFVILHAYVLLQVVLLGRTTAAYNAAVARVELSSEENNSLRQRLANTLFAQIFAGSPREREGWLGWLLKAMAWITLTIAPILILLAFQFSFLAYHSHIATWTHRLLILLELAALFLIWPLALDAQKDFQWPKVGAGLKRTAALTWRLFGPKERRRDEWQSLRQQAAPLAACLLFIVVSLSIATFPGEPHVNLFTWHAPFSVQCDRWLQRKFDVADLRFDRLDLPHVDVIDHEKLEKIKEATKKADEPPYKGERTRIVRGRNLNCSDFSDFSDLSRVDLTASQLRNANLRDANLQGASLDGTMLQNAILDFAQLQGASLADAHLQSASLSQATVQGALLIRTNFRSAVLDDAHFEGVAFTSVELQRASLRRTNLQGASFVATNAIGAILEDAGFEGATLSGSFQGASLNGARLQGADLHDIELQGATLVGTELQGASLVRAKLQGALLERALLQGANFGGADLHFTEFTDVWTWRASYPSCEIARVTKAHADPVLGFVEYFPDFDYPSQEIPLPAEPDKIATFIESSVAQIPDPIRRQNTVKRMRDGLVVNPANDDTAKISNLWSDCVNATHKTFDEDHITMLRDLVCDDSENPEALASGIVHNWISDQPSPLSFKLARTLLGLDGKRCKATKDFDKDTMSTLRAVAAKKPEPTTSLPPSSPAAAPPTPPAAAAPLAPPAAPSTIPPH